MAFAETAQEAYAQLTLRRTIDMARLNIVHRPGRSAITGAGIMLGVAFLSYVLLAGRAEEKALGEVIIDTAYIVQQRWLVSLSLLTCAVGVTNTMLMSVTERYREIGTMKCLGAPDWYIFRLFVLEAAFLGFVGSVMGWILSLLAVLGMLTWSYGLTSVLGTFPWLSTITTLLLAVVVGSVLSVASAILPARAASRMPPAAAMRVEI